MAGPIARINSSVAAMIARMLTEIRAVNRVAMSPQAPANSRCGASERCSSSVLASK